MTPKTPDRQDRKEPQSGARETGDDAPTAGKRWQSGATAIEYGLIAAFVALSVFVGAMVAGNGLGDIFYAMADQIKTSLPED